VLKTELEILLELLLELLFKTHFLFFTKVGVTFLTIRKGGILYDVSF
jgi:hypothetical protein